MSGWHDHLHQIPVGLTVLDDDTTVSTIFWLGSRIDPGQTVVFHPEVDSQEWGFNYKELADALAGHEAVVTRVRGMIEAGEWPPVSQKNEVGSE